MKWPTIGRSCEAMPADGRRERGGLGAPLGRASAAYPSSAGPNGSGAPCSAMYAAAVSMIQSEFASDSSVVSPHAVMPWPPRMQPIACGVLRLDRGDVEAELEAGAAPRHPHDLVAEDLRRELLAVGGGRDGDARVGVQVVDVRRVDEAVHGRVDRRGRAALAVQRVVERGDHLVLAVDAGVDVDERTHAVEAQHGEARSVRVPRSPPEPLTQSSSTGSPVTGSVSVPLAEVLPPA